MFDGTCNKSPTFGEYGDYSRKQKGSSCRSLFGVYRTGMTTLLNKLFGNGADQWLCCLHTILLILILRQRWYCGWRERENDGGSVLCICAKRLETVYRLKECIFVGINVVWELGQLWLRIICILTGINNFVFMRACITSQCKWAQCTIGRLWKNVRSITFWRLWIDCVLKSVFVVAEDWTSQQTKGRRLTYKCWKQDCIAIWLLVPSVELWKRKNLFQTDRIKFGKFFSLVQFIHSKQNVVHHSGNS